MTQTPDEPDEPDEGRDPRDPGSGPGGRRKLDEDAAWRDIVANYGEAPVVEPPSVEPRSPVEPGGDSEAPPQPPRRPRFERPRRPSPHDEDQNERLRGLFQPSWNDPMESEASWDDEGHFIPPDPPAVRVTDSRRQAAWIGLFGAPLLMLIAVVLGWDLPGWLMLGLAAGFVGGFVYLVAQMPWHRGPGDDGAVV